MDELVKQLVDEYKSDKLTWHDIQDIVEGQITIKNGTKDYKQNFTEVNEILTKIENQLKGGE